jgi:nucleotide-binding universal stress UspA family protein
MLERIIVALDGSPSSEAALPAARELARRLGSSLVLLHVIEARPPKTIHGERHLSSPAEAEAYLAPIVAELKTEGIAASAHVHEAARSPEDAPAERGDGLRGAAAARDRGDVASAVARNRGDVASAVAAHEVEFGNDLAILAAHGKRGLAEALSGSLPLKVAASGGAAVLLVPSPAKSNAGETKRVDGAAKGGEQARTAPPAPLAAFAPRRIVVPLDGRPEHEAALPAATTLAEAFGVGILLVGAVPRSAAEAGGPGAAFARLAPALSGASLDYAARGVAEYLEALASRLRARGIAAEALVIRGKPAKAVVAVCGEGDLLALSTHRRLGLDASLDGCVAFGVARRWRGPMLIVPIPRSDSEP